MGKNKGNGCRQAYVTCPFYRRYSATTVRCESFVDGATNTTAFATQAELDFHMREYCCKHFRACEVYRMVMEAKYADDDD